MDVQTSKKELIRIVNRYLPEASERDRLIAVIEDPSRPGLPIRGVLESIRQSREHPDFSVSDKEIIEELLYLYG